MSAKATSNSAVNRNLNSWRQQVNKSAKTCSVKETGSCTFCHLDRWMTRLLVIPLNVFYFYQLRTSILSPVPLLSIVFISVSCTESHSYSTSNSNEFFLVHLIFFYSQLPSFYSSWYLLCVFVVTSVWLVEDVVQRHVSGHWRTFRSQQERVYGGPLGSCVRAHTQANSHKFNHTPVLSSQIPLKESHSHKATERKTKRWNVFSILPLSISFSPTLATVFSRSLQCSTNMQSDQRVWGCQNRGTKWTCVEDKIRKEVGGTQLSIRHSVKLRGVSIPVAHLRTSELTCMTISVLKLLQLLPLLCFKVHALFFVCNWIKKKSWDN